MHRCVAKLRAYIMILSASATSITAGTRTDGADSNPVGLENLSWVCRYYSRHPLLGRRIKRSSPIPSASGHSYPRAYGSPMFPDLSPSCAFAFASFTNFVRRVSRKQRLKADSKTEAQPKITDCNLQWNIR